MPNSSALFEFYTLSVWPLKRNKNQGKTAKPKPHNRKYITKPLSKQLNGLNGFSPSNRRQGYLPPSACWVTVLGTFRCQQISVVGRQGRYFTAWQHIPSRSNLQRPTSAGHDEMCHTAWPAQSRDGDKACIIMFEGTQRRETLWSGCKSTVWWFDWCVSQSRAW